ncbi:MAG: sulfite exporter TauE/SafE family protein [Burkholderiaceae bacterium]
MFTPPLATAPLVMALLVVLGAGIVRGFAGFGFSALCVAALSLLAPPAQIVPPIFVLEVAASISLLRGAARDVDRRWLSWLVLGNALAIPLGIAALAWLPETALRLIIGALLLLAALLLRAGVKLALAPTTPARLAVGLVSGFVNGVAAIGGIAVAVMLNTATLAPAALRATMIALFLFTDLYALAWAALLPGGGADGAALLGRDTLRWALWMMPAMLAGIWIGQRSFAGVSEAAFRRWVLDLLIVIAALGVARAAAALLG